MSKTTDYLCWVAAREGISVEVYMAAQEDIRRQEIEWMKLEAEEADYEEVDCGSEL